MAWIQSAQSGDWNDPDTWVGGVIPHFIEDDVEIWYDHVVTISDNVVMLNNAKMTRIFGTLHVTATGTANLGCSVDVNYSGVFSVAGLATLTRYLTVDGDMLIAAGGTINLYYSLRVYGGLSLGAGATLKIIGGMLALYEPALLELDRKEASVIGTIGLPIIDLSNAYGFAGTKLIGT